MERVRKTLDKCYPAHGGIVNLHTGDMYPHSQVPSLLNYAQHLTFIDSMMIGEVFDYRSSPDVYLYEISGIAFGIMNDMWSWGRATWIR